MLLHIAILCLLAMPFSGFSQVHSLTLGIDVNSPYGLSEPWFTIRGALLRCPELESIAEQADRRTATATLVPKDGRMPDLARIEKAVAESGGGAKVRGIEATVEGELVAKEGKWSLRIPDKNLLLQPFTEAVQQERRRPRTATEEELAAHKRLLEQARVGKRMRVTGPLRYKSGPALEVRLFEAVKPNQSQGKT